jgi:hypothetical protein
MPGGTADGRNFPNLYLVKNRQIGHLVLWGPFSAEVFPSEISNFTKLLMNRRQKVLFFLLNSAFLFTGQELYATNFI